MAPGSVVPGAGIRLRDGNAVLRAFTDGEPRGRLTDATVRTDRRDTDPQLGAREQQLGPAVLRESRRRRRSGSRIDGEPWTRGAAGPRACCSLTGAELHDIIAGTGNRRPVQDPSRPPAHRCVARGSLVGLEGDAKAPLAHRARCCRLAACFGLGYSQPPPAGGGGAGGASLPLHPSEDLVIGVDESVGDDLALAQFAADHRALVADDGVVSHQ